jgi:predicted transcriptional regulator
MLELIFGNKTAERIFLHIFHYGEIHASAIAQDYNISLTPILNQLNRFELAGILVSKEVGKARLYSFNPKSAFTKPVKELIKIVYQNIPLNEKEKIFNKRRRPRRKRKPVI